eukprot:COSAG01_NODE_68179_length_265_cov_0.331325_1_plen_46_part_01
MLGSGQQYNYNKALIRLHFGPLPFFKQKTAYGISECAWSSDVCSSD